jgi:hypothetical protein
MERAQIRALNRQHRVWGRGHGQRRAELPAIASSAGGAQAVGSAGPTAEPAIAEPGQLPPPSRLSLQAVTTAHGVETHTAESRTVDLTAEDDTQALPRLDSLERKLKDLEQQFG